MKFKCKKTGKIVEWEPILICASLVSAQRRRRLFWTNIPNVTQPEDRGILLRDILQSPHEIPPSFFLKVNYEKNVYEVDKVAIKWREQEKSNTIRTSGRGSGIDDKHNWDTIRIGQIGKGGQGDRIYSPEGKSVGLSALGGGRGAKTGLYAVALTETRTDEAKKARSEHMKETGTDSMVAFVIPEATKKGYAIASEGQSIDMSFPNSKTRRGRVGDKVKNIMTSQTIGVVQNMQIRKLTPTECERLQGVPDNYTEEASDSQRYKMLGNAFNVDVVSWILSFIPNLKEKNPTTLR